MDAFRNRRGEAELQECVVAFLDILGVKEMTEGDQQLERLQAIERSLRTAIHATLRDEDIEPGEAERSVLVSTFSDSIVLARTFGTTSDQKDEAVADVAFRVCDLQSRLSVNGIFLRGGLTVGDFFHSEEMVFGSGLVQAWKLEDKLAVKPRVILDLECARLRQAVNLSSMEDLRDELLLHDHDGSVFLNYIAIGHGLDADPGNAFLTEHKAAVSRSLESSRGNPSAWSKCRWVAEYHNDMVKHLEGAKTLRIDTPAGPVRRFEPVEKLKARPPGPSA